MSARPLAQSGLPASSQETGDRKAPSTAPGPLPSGFLRVRGLSKRLGSTQALSAIDIDAGADELVVVLGPTGAGKTTLLRTIAGLETPDAGSISMGSRDVTALDPASRDVALVFQNFSLYPRWSVRRNLEFSLRAPGRNLAEEEIQRRISWAADLLKMRRLLEREASRLSGGEMQRVGIGRAIVRRPKLFLMDEPLTNLDAKLREALRLELVELRRELRTPMLFVTHDQAEALSMGDRIVVLAAGRIQQTGTPREIYENPVSPLVARQLGHPAINLVPVRRVDEHWVGADGTAVMPADPRGASDRLLAVRPENFLVQVFDEGPGTSDERAQAVVKVVEYLGPTTTLLCEWAGVHLHVVLSRPGTVRPGDRIGLSVDAARAVLFDVDSAFTPPPAPHRPAQAGDSSRNGAGGPRDGRRTERNEE